MPIDNQISVRAPSSPVGGPVADEVWTTGGRIDGQSQALLLVHGYNNSYDDAETAYAAFERNVRRAGTTGQAARPVFGFFWPGDTHLKVISTISYPAQLGPAKQSAERLFNYLRSKTGPNGGPLDICLVGHSLGCRVVLELIKRLVAVRGRTAVTIGKVVLMAAAVPVSKVENPGALGGAAAAAATSLVLFSEEDQVLRFAFPIGETFAFDAFWPTAVGRHGQPDGGLWSARLPMVQAAGARGYGHSDYWGGAESAAATAAMLGLPVSVPPGINARAEHELAPARTLPSASLSTWALPASPSFA